MRPERQQITCLDNCTIWSLNVGGYKSQPLCSLTAAAVALSCAILWTASSTGREVPLNGIKAIHYFFKRRIGKFWIHVRLIVRLRTVPETKKNPIYDEENFPAQCKNYSNTFILHYVDHNPLVLKFRCN